MPAVALAARRVGRDEGDVRPQRALALAVRLARRARRPPAARGGAATGARTSARHPLRVSDAAYARAGLVDPDRRDLDDAEAELGGGGQQVDVEQQVARRDSGGRHCSTTSRRSTLAPHCVSVYGRPSSRADASAEAGAREPARASGRRAGSTEAGMAARWRSRRRRCAAARRGSRNSCGGVAQSASTKPTRSACARRNVSAITPPLPSFGYSKTRTRASSRRAGGDRRCRQCSRRARPGSGNPGPGRQRGRRQRAVDAVLLVVRGDDDVHSRRRVWRGARHRHEVAGAGGPEAVPASWQRLYGPPRCIRAARALQRVARRTRRLGGSGGGAGNRPAPRASM